MQPLTHISQQQKEGHTLQLTANQFQVHSMCKYSKRAL